ncbi:MAG: nitrite reductase small subunit NirD [Methylococcaceae bacterium]
MSLWIDICSKDDLQPDSGICALVEDKQVAIFYLPKQQLLYAVDNYDPFGKANVLSRGLVGDINGEPMVASPLHKQHFSLKTGVCLDDQSVTINTYGIRIENDRIEINIKVSSNEI